MYDLLLTSESDSDNCEIDIIAALSQRENLTKNSYLKKKKKKKKKKKTHQNFTPKNNL